MSNFTKDQIHPGVVLKRHSDNTLWKVESLWHFIRPPNGYWRRHYVNTVISSRNTIELISEESKERHFMYFHNLSNSKNWSLA